MTIAVVVKFERAIGLFNQNKVKNVGSDVVFSATRWIQSKVYFLFLVKIYFIAIMK